MYRLVNDGEKLFDQNFDDYLVENPILKLAANKLSTLSFTVYDTNPNYNSINKLKSIITVYRDNEIISLLRPVISKMNMRGGILYTCEDLLARLNDIKRRPSYYTGTKAQYLAAMLNDFNAQYSEAFSYNTLGTRELSLNSKGSDVRELQTALMRLNFDLGSYGDDGIFGKVTERAVRSFESLYELPVDGVFDTGADYQMLISILQPDPSRIPEIEFVVGATPHSDSTTMEFINDDYIGYWDLLQQNLVGQYGGYLVPTYSNNTITINYYDDNSLPISQQSIAFGENLSDIFIESNTTDTFSVLIPLGKDVKATGIQPGQASNTPLTIKTVNSGKDYLESQDGLDLYGRREKTIRWEDISDASELMTMGMNYLNNNAVRLKEKITLSAIDLKYMNVDVDYLTFMTRVYVKSLRHDVMDYYPLTEMQLSLNKPTASKITLGAETETLTDRMSGNTKSVSGMYSTLSGRVFELENR